MWTGLTKKEIIKKKDRELGLSKLSQQINQITNKDYLNKKNTRHNNG